MPISTLRPRVLALTLALVAPVVLPAQTTVTADALMASSFVWRGVHFTNRPVVQGDVYVTHTRGAVTYTSGAWINAEPADYRAANAVRMLAPGHHGPALTAIAPWVDATVQAGPLALTGGATIYRYPERTGFAEGFNTTELYAKLVGGGPLTPRVQMWWDVQKVRGVYLETAVSHTLDTGVPVGLSLTGGWSAGQEVRGTQTAYFARSGFLALDGAVSLPYTRGGLTISPTVHAVLARDAATQLVTPGTSMRRGKIWWSLGGTWTR